MTTNTSKNEGILEVLSKMQGAIQSSVAFTHVKITAAEELLAFGKITNMPAELFEEGTRCVKDMKKAVGQQKDTFEFLTTVIDQLKGELGAEAQEESNADVTETHEDNVVDFKSSVFSTMDDIRKAAEEKFGKENVVGGALRILSNDAHVGQCPDCQQAIIAGLLTGLTVVAEDSETVSKLVSPTFGTFVRVDADAAEAKQAVKH